MESERKCGILDLHRKIIGQSRIYLLNQHYGDCGDVCLRAIGNEYKAEILANGVTRTHSKAFPKDTTMLMARYMNMMQLTMYTWQDGLIWSIDVDDIIASVKCNV